MAKPYQDSRSVQLDGPTAFKGLKVAHFKGREQLSRPFQYDVTLYGSDNPGSDGALDADRILGQSATVALVTTTRKLAPLSLRAADASMYEVVVAPAMFTPLRCHW